MRWLRLGLGLLLITGGIVKADSVAGMLGGLLAFQALLNLGCAGGSCAGGNCAVDYTTKNIQHQSFTSESSILFFYQSQLDPVKFLTILI